MKERLKGRDLDVVVIGDATIALTTDEPLARVGALTRSQRGDALVTCVQASRLGAATMFVTRVGDDALGDWLLESWEREGIHLDFTKKTHGRNALHLVSQVDGPHNAIAYREGSAQTTLAPEDLDGIPWGWTALVFAAGATQALGPGPEATIARAFELGRAAGARTVFDPTLRSGLWSSDAAAKRAFDAILPLTDVLVIGAPYASGKLLGHAAAEDAAREAARRGVRQVVVRDGGRGVLSIEGAELRRVTASADPPSHANDDPSWPRASFDGALLASLARGVRLADAAAFALHALHHTRASTGAGFERLPGEELW